MSRLNEKLLEEFKKEKPDLIVINRILDMSKQIQEEHKCGHPTACYNCKICTCTKNNLRKN